MLYQHKEGVQFRKLDRPDLAHLLRLKSESWWGTHATTIANADDQERWYQNLPANQLFLVGEVVPGGPLAGEDLAGPLGVAVYTDIDPVSRSLRISGSVHKHCRRPRVVRACFAGGLDFAFEMLNMRRVEAEVLDYHAAAKSLELDYLHMRLEGRKVAAAYKCNAYHDSLLLAMLRSEWEADPRVAAYGGVCNLQFGVEWVSRESGTA